MLFAMRKEFPLTFKRGGWSYQTIVCPWASPVILKSQKFYVDYHKLNYVVKSNLCPLPSIDDLLDELGKANPGFSCWVLANQSSKFSRENSLGDTRRFISVLCHAIQTDKYPYYVSEANATSTMGEFTFSNTLEKHLEWNPEKQQALWENSHSPTL